MRPVIEASLQNEYKLLISRIIGTLKTQSKSKDYFNDTFQYRFNEKVYHATLRGTFTGHIKNIRIVEITNALYFLADLDFEITNLYYEFWDDKGSYPDMSDMVLDYIKYMGNLDKNRGYVPSADVQTKDDMLKDGLDKIDVNDDNAIKKSEIYKNLMSHAEEVRARNVGMSCTLKSEVCKRLKERNNVVPLMWINARDNNLNYPWTSLRSRNLMSDSSRTKVGLEDLKSSNFDINHVTGVALRYTPYLKWLVVSMEKVSDEITHII